MFIVKDKLSNFISNLRSENQNFSRIIIDKLEDIKNKNNETNQNYSILASEIHRIPNLLNNIFQNLHKMDNYSNNNFTLSSVLGGIINNFYHAGLNMLIKKLPNSLTQVFSNSFGKLYAGKLLGFSSGGEIPTNNPILVGENGPELFVSKTAGNIIPNISFGNNKNVPIPPININFNIQVQEAQNIHNEIMQIVPEITSLVENSLIYNMQWKNS